MKALVKSKAQPGLWLEDVPEPIYMRDSALPLSGNSANFKKAYV